MSCTLGLWVGESFAEAVLTQAPQGLAGDSVRSSTQTASDLSYKKNESRTQSSSFSGSNREKDSRYSGASNDEDTNLSSTQITSRWFLAKKNLGDGLREILKSAPLPLTSGEVHIATARAEQSLARQIGRSPAFVVTAGFESWLSTYQPGLGAPFLLSSTLSNQHPLVPQDHIFGLNERTSAQGTVELEPKLEDLEFLVAKFQLLEVHDIAIGFLHANRCPENEKQVAHFFRERGFRVVCSHSVSDAVDESTRWQRAIECAYTAESLIEQKEAITEALKAELNENFDNWQIKAWNSHGLQNWPEDPTNATQGGIERALCSHFAGCSENAILHFGLERFYLLHSNSENSGNRSFKITPLELQPTQMIGLSPWLVPSITSEERGYEPGPIAFGKSHYLSALDILFIQEQLDDIEAFTPLIAEKSKSRIQEALFMLGKSIPNTKGPSDPKEIAHDLELTCIERIASALALAQVTGRVRVSGAFAASLFFLLRKRRPDLTFILDAESQWSQALAAGGMQ